MKKLLLFACILLIFSNAQAQFKTFKIQKNVYPELKLVQIDFREYSTLVHMSFVNTSPIGNVIYIDENYFIQDIKSKKKYRLLNSFNLPLGNNNKYALLEEVSQAINFSLEFEKLPDSADNIDIIENPKGNGFNFYGVTINKQAKEKEFVDIDSFIKMTPVKEVCLYYKDGASVQYYNEDGYNLAVILSIDNTYGTYYQASIMFQNLSGKEINFNPNYITAMVHSKKDIEEIKVLDYDEYMRKVRKRQNWNAFAVGFSQSMAASNAGYKNSSSYVSGSISSNTYVSAYGYSGNSYASVYGSSHTYGTVSGTVQTQSYDAGAAYAAQQVANQNTAAYQNQQYEVKRTLSEGYVKRNTISNETEYTGYVNIEYQKTDRILVDVPINGKSHKFIFNISK